MGIDAPKDVIILRKEVKDNRDEEKSQKINHYRCLITGSVRFRKMHKVAVRKDFRAGHKAVLMELPTGTGKTHTFVLLLKAGARTLVIVPFISLISQTVKSIRKLRECEPDIEQADLSATPECEFVVASWQTLHSNERWRKFVGKVDLVVVDEAHYGFTVREP